MKTYQTVIKCQMDENGKSLTEIERTKTLWPILVKMQKEYDIKLGSTWCDWEGINVFISDFTKREAFIFLDDFFWSRGMETTDPSFTNGRMRVNYESPKPVFGEGRRPLILLCFEIKLDDTCRRVFDGFTKTEKYKWICD